MKEGGRGRWGGGGGGKARDLIERDTRRQRHTDKQTDRESKSEKYALEIRIKGYKKTKQKLNAPNTHKSFCVVIKNDDMTFQPKG